MNPDGQGLTEALRKRFASLAATSGRIDLFTVEMAGDDIGKKVRSEVSSLDSASDGALQCLVQSKGQGHRMAEKAVPAPVKSVRKFHRLGWLSIVPLSKFVLPISYQQARQFAVNNQAAIAACLNKSYWRNDNGISQSYHIAGKYKTKMMGDPGSGGKLGSLDHFDVTGKELAGKLPTIPLARNDLSWKRLPGITIEALFEAILFREPI